MIDANLDPEDMDRLEEMGAKIDRLIERVDAVETRLAEAWEKIEPMLAEVLPLLEKLEASPMFKMLTAGGKKK